MTTLLDTALAYHRAGLVVLPNDPLRKFPAGLKGWQHIRPTERDIRAWFGNGAQHAIGVRDIEGLDIDNKGNPSAEKLYEAWAALVEKQAPGLVARLLCEETPSGGFHLVWRCSTIDGNQKLATRPPTEEEKRTQPALTNVALIETRGKGGQFQVAPSPGYILRRGSWTALPTITPEERAVLLSSARALSRGDARTISLIQRSTGERAGDRFNQEGAGEALQLLERAGWVVAYEQDGAKYLIRPGKHKGVGATFGFVAPGVLYVFSSNASPFESGKAYAPFAVFAELAHGGDYKRAARALYERTEVRARQSDGRHVDLSTGEIEPKRTASVQDWRHAGTTAAQLYSTEFEPLIWTVENILPEGCALLAGKPKSRKSWAALGVTVACVTGAKAFGKLESRQGRALYLDLESNQRRMRGRLFSMVGHKMRNMDNLHIFTEWPRAEDGLQALEAWMDTYPDTVLICIDVLADFRRPRDPKEDIYAYDRETVRPINEFAERRRVTVILVHHTRKAKSDDVFDEISGSTGLPSAVATMWVLGRAPNGSGEMILALRGRDLINDEPLALEWDDYDNQFKIVGGAVDALQGAEKRSVLKVMADDEEWGPKEVATELRKPVNNVQQLMKVLLSEGLIERTGRGKYVRVLSRDQNDQNDQIHKITKSDQNSDQKVPTDSEELPKAKFDSDLPRQDQNQDQNRLARRDALGGPSDHSDRVLEKSESDELFAGDVPDGLTPAQWEQARYFAGLGAWSDFGRVARECGLGWDALRKLVGDV